VDCRLPSVIARYRHANHAHRIGLADSVVQFLRRAGIVETHIDHFGAVVDRVVDGIQDVGVITGSVNQRK
jgi:hypothetical protein